MTEEFILSNKGVKEQISCPDRKESCAVFHFKVSYPEKDVKEFIKRFRIVIQNKEHYNLEEELNKLAGKRLTE